MAFCVKSILWRMVSETGTYYADALVRVSGDAGDEAYHSFIHSFKLTPYFLLSNPRLISAPAAHSSLMLVWYVDERHSPPNPFLERPVASDCTVHSSIAPRTFCWSGAVATVIGAVVMVLTAAGAWPCRVQVYCALPDVDQAFPKVAQKVDVLLIVQPFAFAKDMHVY